MKLWFEKLERRDLLTVLRMASWNTANNPDTTAEDLDFETVFQAIGTESVQGNATRIDLLALQETDIVGAGNNSIFRIESILEGLYPGVDYGTAVTGLDGGGDATGFVYDTTTLSLLGTQELTAGLTHNTLRGEFRPIGTSGDADFFVYTTHLKAGNSGSDQTTRGNEAATLRSDADALGVGASVIVAGDFNIQDSFEAAYSNFLAAGPGPAQLQDPINTPGNWHNNSAFRSVHTQNPADPSLGGGGMDDRFDFQLVTGEFFDGFGIDYVSGSYHAFGNNGTHALNGSITSGTGAAPNVLQALASASDHLPVVADYEVLGGGVGVSIVESGGSTQVVEGGAIDTYTVTLTSVPTADVTVTVTPDIQSDVGAGSGGAISLIFTPANALTGQTVVVTAHDDLVPEGTHSSTITHSSSSSDPNYDALAISSVIATVLDNETPTVVINELDADTDGVDMLEFIELYDGGVGNSSLDGLSLVLYNGSSDTSYAAFDLDGFTTNNDGFFLLGNSGVNPAPDITFGNNSLQNGADAAALYLADATAFPNGTAVTTTNLLDAIVYDTNDPDDAGLLSLLAPLQPQVNEDENNNRLFESLARVPDGGNARETTTYIAQAPTPGTLNVPPAAGVVVVQSGGRTDVEEGGATDTYTIALLSSPASNVQVTVTPDAQVDVGNGPGVATQLTFTPANGVIPQTVTVVATDDNDIEGPHTGLIAHTATSADTNYNNINIGDVIANVTDNEATPATNVVITEIMYNPDSDESEPGVGEWIEVANKGNVPVALDGWTFEDEDTSDWGAIPVGTTLAVGQVAVFFDTDFTTEAIFRSAWSVPSGALVVGIDWGSLANGPSATNEVLELLDNGGQTQDVVNYDDSGAWPSDSPDGPSIYLIDVAADNNVGSNWARSILGADNAVSPTAPFSNSDVGSPGYVDCPPVMPDGDFNDDGLYDCLDVDALVAAIAQGSTDLAFDLTGDGNVDNADLTAWLSEAGEANLGPGKMFLFGDANLNGIVDATDFTIWSASKFTSTAAWCSGDFNASGVVDAVDFTIWSANKFTSSAPPSGTLPDERPTSGSGGMSWVPQTETLVGIEWTPPRSAWMRNIERPARLAKLRDRAFADNPTQTLHAWCSLDCFPASWSHTPITSEHGVIRSSGK